MADVKVYDLQDGDPHRTVLVAFYERYRREKGSTDIAEMEAVRFAEFLLGHLEEYQEELKSFTAIEWAKPPKLRDNA